MKAKQIVDILLEGGDDLDIIKNGTRRQKMELLLRNNSTDVFKIASRDKDPLIRWCVCGVPNLSVEMINFLAKSPDSLVRYYVLRRKGTIPVTILNILKNDVDSRVRRFANLRLSGASQKQLEIEGQHDEIKLDMAALRQSGGHN